MKCRDTLVRTHSGDIRNVSQSILNNIKCIYKQFSSDLQKLVVIWYNFCDENKLSVIHIDHHQHFN